MNKCINMSLFAIKTINLVHSCRCSSFHSVVLLNSNGTSDRPQDNKSGKKMTVNCGNAKKK